MISLRATWVASPEVMAREVNSSARRWFLRKDGDSSNSRYRGSEGIGGLQIYLAFPHIGQKNGVYPVPNPLDSARFPEWARLGGWLAGGINWHFALAWPFVITGLVYLGFLAATGEWRSLLFRPRDVKPALAMQAYYLRLRREHPPQGKHNALQKAAYTTAILLGMLAVLTGFAIAKPIQLGWLTAAFGKAIADAPSRP